MNFFATRIVLRQIILWCVLVAVVALLTLLFTILGTLTCAVLTGMMMAASDHRRWQTVPVSLVFPGVVIGMVETAKVELVGAQLLLLPSLCFGAFWMTYLSTRAIVRMEKRQSSRSNEKTIGQTGTPAIQSMHSDAPRGLTLGELQGRWCYESLGPDGTSRRQIIEVIGDELHLSVLDPEGRLHRVAVGTVVLKTSLD